MLIDSLFVGPDTKANFDAVHEAWMHQAVLVFRGDTYPDAPKHNMYNNAARWNLYIMARKLADPEYASLRSANPKLHLDTHKFNLFHTMLLDEFWEFSQKYSQASIAARRSAASPEASSTSNVTSPAQPSTEAPAPMQSLFEIQVATLHNAVMATPEQRVRYSQYRLNRPTLRQEAIDWINSEIDNFLALEKSGHFWSENPIPASSALGTWPRLQHHVSEMDRQLDAINAAVQLRPIVVHIGPRAKNRESASGKGAVGTDTVVGEGLDGEAGPSGEQ